jgi:hypothetical protein
MAKITTRYFPIFLLALWLVAVFMLFCSAVYGDFDILVDATRKGELQREMGRIAKDAEQIVAQTGKKTIEALEQEEKKIAAEFGSETKNASKEDGSGSDMQESSPVAESGRLQKAEFKAGAKVFRAFLEFSTQPPKHKWFTMKNPALLVIDFSGQWKQEVQRRQVFTAGPINKVIFGRHQDFLRMALYYSHKSGTEGPAPIIRRQDKRISISVPAGKK